MGERQLNPLAQMTNGDRNAARNVSRSLRGAQFLPQAQLNCDCSTDSRNLLVLYHQRDLGVCGLDYDFVRQLS